MKKRVVSIVCILMIVTLCACIFAACGDRDSDKYTVSFDLGAYVGSAQAPPSVTKDNGGKMNLPTAADLPVWEGHTFEGWKLNNEGALLSGGAEITVTADAKYYAQWKEDDEEGDKLSRVLPKEELTHAISYIMTVGKSDSASLQILCNGQAETADISGSTFDGFIYISASVGNGPAISMRIIFFDSDEAARKYGDCLAESQPFIKYQVVGNRMYSFMGSPIELNTTAYDFYTNTVLKCPMPTDLSQTRLNFMLDAAANGNFAYQLEFNIAAAEENFLFDFMARDNNRTNQYAYCTEGEASDPQYVELATQITNDGDVGSYANYTLETGYVFYRYIEKTGLKYEITGERAKVIKYCYDENSSLQPEIPAEIEKDGRRIKVAGIYMYGIQYCPITSVKIDEGVEYLMQDAFDECWQLETVYLPRSLTAIFAESFNDCVAIKTIYYGGSAAEWMTLAGDAVVNAWCDGFDWSGQEPIEKHNSFKVICTDGRQIQYPVGNRYTVSFDLGAYEGAEHAPEDATAYENDTLRLPTMDDLPDWEGHTFEGWKLNDEGMLLDGGAEITVTANVTYYAQWSENIVQRDYEEGSIYEFLSEAELARIISYTVATGKQQGRSMDFNIYVNPVYIPSPGIGYIYLNIDGDESIEIYFLETEEQTQAYQDTLATQEGKSRDDMRVVGNRIYCGSADGVPGTEYYERNVLTAQIPTTLSETRLEFMLDAAAHRGETFALYVTNSEENFLYDMNTSEYAYCTAEEAQDNSNDFGELKEKINNNGADGSYVNDALENGYVFFKYIKKPQFEYDVTEDEATLTKYNYDIDLSTEVEIPEEIEREGRRIAVVGIRDHAFDGANVTSVRIPRGIRTINTPFNNCAQLETIYFGGSVSEWKALTQNRDISNWSGKNTLTVICDGDERIKYPCEYIEYIVSFELGAFEGEGQAPASTTKVDGDTMNLPKASDLPEWEGHMFEGWKLDGNGKLIKGGAEITVTADAIYIAQWHEFSTSRKYEEGSVYDLVTEDEISRLVNYAIARGDQEGQHVEIFVINYAQNAQLPYKGIIRIEVNSNEVRHLMFIFIFADSSIAQQYKDVVAQAPIVESGQSATAVGNRVYVGNIDGEDGYGYYVNKILNAEVSLTQALSAKRRDFMFSSLTHGGKYISSFAFDIGENSQSTPGEGFIYALGDDPNIGNILEGNSKGKLSRGYVYFSQEFMSAVEEQLGEDLEEKFKSVSVDGGCSFDRDSEAGYIFIECIIDPEATPAE